MYASPLSSALKPSGAFVGRMAQQLVTCCGTSFYAVISRASAGQWVPLALAAGAALALVREKVIVCVIV